MSNLIKKTMLAGLGVLSLSRKKAEGIARDLVKRGELAKTEEAKFVKDLMERVEKSKSSIEEKTEKIVKKTLAKLDLPTRKELNELKTKIDKLIKKLR